MDQENYPSVCAPDILTAGAKHMRDRAALRDSPSGERSMKRCVEAFNALEGTNLTETQGWRFMAVLKHARATQGSLSMDDYEDWAAYAALAGESAAKESAQIELMVPESTAVEFSMNNPPLLGQEYYYLSNTGVIAARRWQSTPQEWKRLHKGQVFKSGNACSEKGYHAPYIFHEDDPVRYPEIGDQVWLIRMVVNGVNDSWVADSKPYRVVSTDIGSGATDLTINYAKGWHEQGELFHSKEHAEAKALWRNLSMQRHGTPYGPLHPDANQYDEPLSDNDEGEEHD